MSNDIPSASPTGKVIIEGDQSVVEALADQFQVLFEVTHRSRFNRIAHKPGHVRCYLHIVPLPGCLWQTPLDRKKGTGHK